MSEFQKIAIGLLSMSHPEIHRFRKPYSESSTSKADPSGSNSTPSPRRRPAATALRGLKFALAALLAGARSIPMGDNGCLTRDLSEYGKRLENY